MITPSSLHFVGTHRGAIVPEIDPKEYRLLIHGMVDHPLEFTHGGAEALPLGFPRSFLECLGNRSRPEYKTVQETHGLTSCSEWTGVPLSTLLKECGVQKGASWVVSEGSEEVKGAGSIRLAKAMDDVHRGLRPKWRTAASAAWFPGAADRSRLRGNLQHQVAAANQGRRPLLHDLQRLRPHLEGPQSRRADLSSGDRNRSSPFLPADSSCPVPVSTRSRAWPGPAEAPFAKWKSPPTAARPGKRRRFEARCIPWRTPDSAWTGSGTGKSACSSRAASMNSARCNRRRPNSPNSSMWPPDYYKTHGMQGTDNTIQPWRVASDGSVHNALA